MSRAPCSLGPGSLAGATRGALVQSWSAQVRVKLRHPLPSIDKNPSTWSSP